MAKKSRKPADRIKEFTSLAEYAASTAKEGDIDAPVFEHVPIRRVVHQGAPWFSVIEMISALTESDNPGEAGLEPQAFDAPDPIEHKPPQGSAERPRWASSSFIEHDRDLCDKCLITAPHPCSLAQPWA